MYLKKYYRQVLYHSKAFFRNKNSNKKPLWPEKNVCTLNAFPSAFVPENFFLNMRFVMKVVIGTLCAAYTETIYPCFSDHAIKID